MTVGIPAGNFSSNHACRVARRMNQARNRTAGNTLLMRIASNLYMKMAASGCPYYVIFAIFPAIRKNKFPKIKITANIFLQDKFA